MKVRCQNCGNLYDIKETKVTKAKIKFKCRQCQEYVYVYKKDIKSNGDSGKSQKVCPTCGHRLEPHEKECPLCNLQLEKKTSDSEPKQSEDIDSTPDNQLKETDKKDTNSAEEKKESVDVLMFCRSCLKTISTSVDSCPHCGESYTP